MGRASSSKKVARASRATGRPGAGRNWAFPGALALVALAGVALIVVSRPENAVASPPIVGQDHWHAAYGIYQCDEFLPPLVDAGTDTSGIHSHGDGLIHIHPFPGNGGERANLGAFAETVGLTLDDDSLEAPGGETLENGDDCGGEPGLVQVRVWENSTDEEGRLLEGDFGDYAVQDGEVVTVAFVPEGADIPKPPSVGTVPSDLEAGAPENADEDVPTPTTVAGQAPEGEAPAESTVPPADDAETPSTEAPTTTATTVP